MVPIENIGNLPPEFRRTARNEKQDQVKRSSVQDARAPTNTEKGPRVGSDQVQLSDSAKTLLQRDAEVARLTAEMPAIQTLSSEARLEIESKIESGFYTSNEVTTSIAGKITEDTDTAEPEGSSITPTRMQEVLDKIRSNQYDSQNVVDVIADRILKDL